MIKRKKKECNWEVKSMKNLSSVIEFIEFQNKIQT